MAARTTTGSRRQTLQRSQPPPVSKEFNNNNSLTGGNVQLSPASTTRSFSISSVAGAAATDITSSAANGHAYPPPPPAGVPVAPPNFNPGAFANYNFIGDGNTSMTGLPLQHQQNVYELNNSRAGNVVATVLNEPQQRQILLPHGNANVGVNNGQNIRRPRVQTSTTPSVSQSRIPPSQHAITTPPGQSVTFYTPLSTTSTSDNLSSAITPMTALSGITEAALEENKGGDAFPATIPGSTSINPFLVPHPPNLEAWREKLFYVDSNPLVLSEEDYLTYFPHVDNVYSHRSTQKYKRKSFVSHYWDCRLKGRPSGTPKSDDPNKKKRKRLARERDLCDVKIKVTEYFSADDVRKLNLTPNAGSIGGGMEIGEGELTVIMEDGMEPANAFGILEPARRLPRNHPGAEGRRWFSIQRVNGTAAGGDDDPIGVDDDNNTEINLGHKHTLEESDRIKKNSIQRQVLKEEKERKKQGKLAEANGASDQRNSLSGSLYLASGPAQLTVQAHKGQSSQRLKFYGNSFCPFSQRIWIALEVKGIPYQYFEVLPSQVRGMRPMPADMLEGNPEGKSPCVRHGSWTVWESGVLMEYLEDLDSGQSLLPKHSPHLRAHCRLWTDHINRRILPAFYSLLLTPLPGSQADVLNQQRNTSTGPDTVDRHFQAGKYPMLVKTLHESITTLVNASHAVGPFFMGSEIGYVDVAFAPWIVRISRVLQHHGKFPQPEVGTRWQQWTEAVEADPRVKRTVSDDEAYRMIYAVAAGQGSIIEQSKAMVEMEMAIEYACQVLGHEGFGLGGDILGRV